MNQHVLEKGRGEHRQERRGFREPRRCGKSGGEGAAAHEQ